MIAVTGSTGQLGRLVIASLLKSVPAAQIVAIARDPQKADDLATLGVQIRLADYDKPETLSIAFTGVEKLLLISASEVGKRAAQHRAVIDAARTAGLGLIAYTSLLRADVSPLALAAEHRATEAALERSGVPYVLLRNGWYLENYMAGVPKILQSNVVVGSAGDGRIASASRADYADAAVAVLTAGRPQAGLTYELAGRSSFSLPEFAAELAKQSGAPIHYKNLAESEYRAGLISAGVPETRARLMADSHVGAANGALFADEPALEELIGRPATTLQQAIASTLSR